MKTRDLEWYDLFHMRGTRRDFLRLSGGVTGLVALGSLPACGTERSLALSANPFTLGVASGDPTSDGVVLWSRLARSALEAAQAADASVAVDWEIAEDDGFTRIAQSGSASATPQLGHSVHVEAAGLEPGREYFYRMMAGGQESPVGRTKTAPAVGAPVDRFRFAFASCQHYEHGLYTALGHLAEEDVDLIVHLGDYIYEMSYGENLVRHHDAPEPMTLDEYRARYTMYRSDPNLMAAHASAPWVVTWDDHEVDNNYADDIAEDEQTVEELLLRRAAAYQAFYEFMPLRRAAMPVGPDAQLYRRLRFGDLIEMDVLDTRQYRSDQPCGDRSKPSCAEHIAPDRSMLGARQRDWLFEGLAATEARWNVLAQQVMMARLRGTNAEGDETWSMDMWDGYPAEREALLRVLGDVGAANPIVLTGDIHSHWVADLHTDFDDLTSPIVATELVGTSISSNGDGQDMTASGERRLSSNPHIKFYNGQRGYVTAEVTPELWTSEFKIVPRVTEPGAAIETRATFVVENGRPGAQEG
jgi:alkaline phosphatase D